jgi:hypothetical protein
MSALKLSEYLPSCALRASPCDPSKAGMVWISSQHQPQGTEPMNTEFQGPSKCSRKKAASCIIFSDLGSKVTQHLSAAFF